MREECSRKYSAYMLALAQVLSALARNWNCRHGYRSCVSSSLPLTLRRLKSLTASVPSGSKAKTSQTSSSRSPRSTRTQASPLRKTSVANDLPNSPTHDHYPIHSSLPLTIISIMGWSTNEKYPLLHSGRRKSVTRRRLRSRRRLRRGSRRPRVRSGATMRPKRRWSRRYHHSHTA